ncbi:MAG: serine/threonine protein kinase [Anaerolineae bacterium]|nr:serine/threonine protein kinase [Anaerolineae bacterium]
MTVAMRVPEGPEVGAEPPDPEFYCVRCRARLDKAPELKPQVQLLDFMCPQCRERTEREYRLAEERSRERYLCSECGRDVTEMARRDGRAEELREVALYLCSICGNRLRQQRQILGYWVIQRLGVGGAGEVYKVWHPETGRVAALKRMLPLPEVDPRLVLRFQREIIVMQDLRHPNIVRLYEAGLDGDFPVFVSEFAPGGDFTQFIDENGRPLLPPEEVVSLIADSLTGLGYLHSRGYVHRDLKPENLLLKPVEGRLIPKVADFGLARSYEQRGGTITRTGEFGGTWVYMPPEQLFQFKEVKPSVDIYAMGAITYFLLSGNWPLPDFPTYIQMRSGGYGPLPRTPAQMVLRDPRVPLEERLPDLPRALCQAVNTAIAMKPEDRYQTAEEFRQALLASV